MGGEKKGKEEAAGGGVVGGIDGIGGMGRKFKGKEREREGKSEGKGNLREGYYGKLRRGSWSGKERGKRRKGEAAEGVVVGRIEKICGVGKGSCGRGCCGRHRGG